MRTIFLFSFAFVAAIHLVSIFVRQRSVTGISKVLLVPLILALYISRTESLYIPVIIALVFGWLGDIFLLKISDIRFFRLGLASFLVGHICYIPSMLHFSGRLNFFALLLSLTIALPLGILLRALIHPNREMNIPVIAYEMVIILMTASALQLFLARGTPFGILVFAGSLCFLVSDSILAYFTFRKRKPIGDFLVMSTYITAQLCIALGLAGF
jgi:uncharacterized membrane protein YhhN